MTNKIKYSRDWIQVLTILLGVFSMFLWSQREFRSEMRALKSETRADMRDFHKAIKDFHGRLCKIEEKYYQMEKRNVVR